MSSEIQNILVPDQNKDWSINPPQGDFVVLERYPLYKIYETGHVVKYRKVTKNKTLKIYFLDNYAVVKLFDKQKETYRPVYLHQLIGEAFHEYDRYTHKLMYAPINEAFPYHKDNFSVRPNARMGLRGENNYKSKIDANKVLEIRAMRESGKTIMEIARIFNLSKGQISMICNRKRWGWL